jgi:hypothetical protein
MAAEIFPRFGVAERQSKSALADAKALRADSENRNPSALKDKAGNCGARTPRLESSVSKSANNMHEERTKKFPWEEPKGSRKV